MPIAATAADSFDQYEHSEHIQLYQYAEVTIITATIFEEMMYYKKSFLV